MKFLWVWVLVIAFANTTPYLQKSLEYIKQEKYHQAIIEAQRVFNDKQSDNKNNYTAHKYIGYAHQRLYQFGDAIKHYYYLLSHTSNQREKSQVYNNMALCYQELGNFEQSLKMNQEALGLKKTINSDGFDKAQRQQHSKSMANSYHNIGELYRMQRQYDQVLEPYQMALKLRQKYLGKEDELTLQSYSAIASFYGETGDYTQAIKYLFKVIEIGKKHHYDSLKDNYQDMGRNYQKSGKLDKALIYYQKSLDLRKGSSTKRDIDWSGGAYLYMAQIYNDQNQSVKAMHYAKKALRNYQKVFGFDNFNIATTYQTIATIYFAQKEYNQSLAYNTKALHIRQKLFEDNIDVADSHYYLSKDYLQLKKYQEALDHAIKSFDLFMQNQKAHYLVLTNEQKRSYNQHYGARAKFSNLFDIAYHYLNNSEDNATKDNALKEQIFNKWLSFKGRVSNREDTIAQLYKKIKKLKNNIEALKTTKAQLSTLYKTYPNQNDTAKIAKLQKRIKQAKAKKQALEIELNKSDKIFKELLALQHIEHRDIMRILEPHQLYIDFARADKQYYLFTIGKEGSITFDQLSIQDTQAIESNITAFREENQKIIESEQIDIIQTQRYLYHIHTILIDRYLKKAMVSKDFLIISPDGMLNFFPFETLYDNKHYLIEDKAISYIPSAKHLLFNQKEFSTQMQSNDQTVVVFAHPNYNMGIQTDTTQVVRVSLDELPKSRRLVDFKRYYEDLNGSLEELHYIQKLYQNQVYAFQDDNATAQNLLNIQSPAILHISTHGYFQKQISNEYLMQSGLLLAGANRALFDKNTTGIVSAFALSNLDLSNTNLVVLSACDTGLGKIENAEGVVGLPKAFIQAGAKNIIMSLWSVNDAKTATLMKKFYYHLHNDKNQNYIDALRKAKLEMIEEHPYYWSGFILSGI